VFLFGFADKKKASRSERVETVLEIGAVQRIENEKISELCMQMDVTKKKE